MESLVPKLTFGKLEVMPMAELRAELKYWDSMVNASHGATQVTASRHAQRCLEVIRDRTSATPKDTHPCK